MSLGIGGNSNFLIVRVPVVLFGFVGMVIFEGLMLCGGILAW